jgi:hypothetical protein
VQLTACAAVGPLAVMPVPPFKSTVVWVQAMLSNELTMAVRVMGVDVWFSAAYAPMLANARTAATIIEFFMNLPS